MKKLRELLLQGVSAILGAVFVMLFVVCMASRYWSAEEETDHE